MALGLSASSWHTTGPQTVTATDTVTSITTGTCPQISVAPGAAGAVSALSVQCLSTATAGALTQFTVTAIDAAGNTINSYTGTVHFTSSEAGTLPADRTLTSGVGRIHRHLNTAGNQTITATDTPTARSIGD